MYALVRLMILKRFFFGLLSSLSVYSCFALLNTLFLYKFGGEVQSKSISSVFFLLQFAGISVNYFSPIVCRFKPIRGLFEE